jgi:hypothetical protein
VLVDLAEIQVAYYMVAATGVLVAATFYVINLRETRTNIRITLTNNIMQTLYSATRLRQAIEMLHMEWTDYEDFEKKYGTEKNIDSASIRLSLWYNFNTLGELLRRGLVDEDTLYYALGWNVVTLWQKFESVVIEHRRRYMSKDQWTGFEYLAKRMFARMNEVDPGYKVPKTYDKYIREK